MTATYKPLFIAPETIMCSPLSAKAKLVWGQLKFHLNRVTGKCNPGYKLVAEELKISKASVYRAVEELRRAGLIAATKHTRTSSYVLFEDPQPVEAVENAETGDFRDVKLTSQDTSKRRRKTRQIDVAAPTPSLYEPTEVNLKKGTDDADAVLRVVEWPVEKAAAAAQDCFAFNEPEEPEQNQNPAPEPLAAAELIVAELMPTHPEPGNEGRAVEEAARILASKPEEIAATVETIRQTHAACRTAWANYGPGRFIPQLWRWFRDGDWKYLRPDRREVQRETYDQRRRREAQTEDEETCRMYAELNMWDAMREHSGSEAVEVWREKVKRAS